METGLRGKLILVTGSAKGIGRAIATALAKEGARVVVHCYRSQNEAAALVQALRESGHEAAMVRGDLSDLNAVRDMQKQIKAHFPEVSLYGVVNNAGWYSSKRLLEYRAGEWRREIDVNFYGLVHLLYVFLPEMIANREGKWVNIVGDVSRVGDPNLVMIGAARAAAINLIKSVAQEYGRFNLHFNAIALGLVDQGYLGLDEAIREKVIKRYPLRRLGRPEDVADAVMYLLSKRADWVTGQVLPVNGGFTMIN
ncbi:MAG: SDR family oxidoreductase [Hydrogenibacillus schlegelii]|uniref:SDR family oxidoreductase n=1 Tax=Hydrogenibacillus schlegelii TaxID=1484 RepID=A0A947G8Y1_HYDSH|nr:SDR family oxidoreductase [Hydrogenibacillus schlegelii]